MTTVKVPMMFRGRVPLLLSLAFPAMVVADEVKVAEKPLPAAILRKYDANTDGQLSDEERAAWRADVQRGRAEAQARRLEKHDLNRDGKLDKDERAAAKADKSLKKSAKKSPAAGSDVTATKAPLESGKGVKTDPVDAS